MNPELKIGEVARRSGVTVDTVRYYGAGRTYGAYGGH